MIFRLINDIKRWRAIRALISKRFAGVTGSELAAPAPGVLLFPGDGDHGAAQAGPYGSLFDKCLDLYVCFS